MIITFSSLTFLSLTPQSLRIVFEAMKGEEATNPYRDNVMS
jgi:hypothetical protein